MPLGGVEGIAATENLVADLAGKHCRVTGNLAFAKHWRPEMYNHPKQIDGPISSFLSPGWL